MPLFILLLRPYGRRTKLVRVLSVVDRSLARDTGPAADRVIVFGRIGGVTACNSDFWQGLGALHDD